MNKDAKLDVTVTTQVRLTLKGQTFDLTMEELRELYEKIRPAVEAHYKEMTVQKVDEGFIEKLKKAQADKLPFEKPIRPFYPPQPPLSWEPQKPHGPICKLHLRESPGLTTFIHDTDP